MKTVTDNKFRNFKYRHEVPAKILRYQFDYMPDDEMGGFIKYRGIWYHLSEFMRTPDDMKPWHGYHSDTFFSAVVIAPSDDGEQYKIGLMLA